MLPYCILKTFTFKMVKIEKPSTKIQKNEISGKDYLDVEIIGKWLEFHVLLQNIFFYFDTQFCSCPKYPITSIRNDCKKPGK